MASVKITDLAAYTAPETTDVMPIVDVATDTTKKVAVGEVVGKITGDVDVATDGTSSITAGAIVNADVNANAEIAVSKLADGTARQLLQTDAAGAGVEWTSNIDVPGTLDVTGATTLDSTLQVGGNTTIEGNLTVEGTTTTIETTTLLVEDKNIEMGVVGTPTDTTADGGGITLKGATDKTLNWLDATDSWTSSENVDLASGKSYRINNTEVLNSTTLGSGVTGSSLTSVGTISSGTWQGTAIDAAYLDSTVVTTGDTGTVTSTMIADGTIVNGDINASAAIAGTKIAPDFGSQTVKTTGVFSAAAGSNSAPSLTFTGDLDTGFYSPTTDEIGASVAGGEALRIDSSGRLLVGTSSTSELARAVFQGNYAGNPGRTYFTSASNAPGVASTLAKLVFADSGHVSAAEIDVQRDGGTWTSGSSQPTSIAFSTTADGAASPTERVRIDSNGILITRKALGSTFYSDTGTDLRVFSNTSGDSGAVSIESSSSSTSTRVHITFSNPNGVVGSIRTSGSSTSYNTSSDYRLKENIAPVTDGVARLQQLKPSRFNFIADPDTIVDGFLAHEVQTVVPEAITGTKDEVDDEGNPQYQGIDQSKLVPLLTAALQEAIGEIESLKARVAALEAS